MKYEQNLKSYAASNTSFNAFNAMQQIEALTEAVLELRGKLDVLEGMLADVLHQAKPTKKAPESKL